MTQKNKNRTEHRSHDRNEKQLFWSMNGRTNLQETTALLLNKMEVNKEIQMNRGVVDDLDI